MGFQPFGAFQSDRQNNRFSDLYTDSLWLSHEMRLMDKAAILSNNFVSGSAGFKLSYDGSAELNDVTIRGDLESSNYVAGTSGYFLDWSTGSAEFNDVTVRGAIYASSGEFTGSVTLTGSGAFKTSASGQRWELTAAGEEELVGYTGQANEINPNKLVSGYDPLALGYEGVVLRSATHTGATVAGELVVQAGASLGVIYALGTIKTRDIWISTGTSGTPVATVLRFARSYGSGTFDGSLGFKGTAGLMNIDAASATYFQINSVDQWYLNASGNWVDSTNANLIFAGNGTAAFPTYNFASDTDNGMYKYATNEIGFATAGTHMFSISTTGFRSNPTAGAYILAAAGTAAGPTYAFNGDKDTGMYRATGDVGGLSAGGTEIFKWHSSGYSGGWGSMSVGSSGNTAIGWAGSTGGFMHVARSNSITGLWQHTINNATSYRIHSFYRRNVEAGYIAITGTTTAYITTSDYRRKKNIRPVTGALDMLHVGLPKRFKFKGPRAGGEQIGYIAHEIEPVIPWGVTGEKDEVDEDGNPVYQGVDAAKMVPILHAAILELEERVALLEVT